MNKTRNLFQLIALKDKTDYSLLKFCEKILKKKKLLYMLSENIIFPVKNDISNKEDTNNFYLCKIYTKKIVIKNVHPPIS